MSNFFIALDNSEIVIQASYAQIEKALKSVALTAEKYAKQDCPVDTGRLRSSITHETDKNTAYIGTNVEYAPYVERGTSRMRAQPFLEPAMEQHLSEYKEMIETILKG